MTQLVLLVSPSVIKTHNNEPLLRQLFEKHKYDNADTVGNFLDENNIKYTMEVGENEHGNALLSYSIAGERLFGIKY